jgi:putative peptidoglycan lipid II flippase
MREILALLGPGTIGLAATQVNLFVSTLLATTQGTGAVSWLTYAFRVMYLPIGLFGVSIGTAVLPAVSRHTAAADDVAVRRTSAQGLAMMVVLNVPATVGLLVLADPIVTLLFERGRFRPEDTAMTAAALRLYAIGLVGYAAVRIVSPIFYAIRQSRVPVIVSTCSIALNILASVALVPVLGFRGLALGTSLATIANGGLLVALLRRRLNGIDGARLSSTCLKTVAASILMAMAAIAIERGLFAVWPTMSLGAQVLRLGATIAGGLVVLAVAGKLLRIREFDDLLAVATRRGSTVAPPEGTNLK